MIIILSFRVSRKAYEHIEDIQKIAKVCKAHNIPNEKIKIWNGEFDIELNDKEKTLALADEIIKSGIALTQPEYLEDIKNLQENI